VTSRDLLLQLLKDGGVQKAVRAIVSEKEKGEVKDE
jgi:hypothetical protein